MIVIVSNRQVNEDQTDHRLFGERSNANGLDEIRLATAAYDDPSQSWALSLIPEGDLSESIRPSQQIFQKAMADIKAGRRKKNWVFYIHGFNQSILDNLNACREIQTLYDVDVLTFAWPSNPGGFVIGEYQRARQAARASSNALARTLEILGRYLASRPLEEMRNCRISFNLLVHSLGNTLAGLNAQRAIYLDFTSGENVDRSHNFFDSEIENVTIKTILTRLLNGQRGETVTGLTFDPSLNAFRL